ncbi:RidA family protein [Chitinimonas naiadis]
MPYPIETFTPPNTPEPIGPYSHIAKAGPFIQVSGTAGVDPVSGQLAGPDAYSQTRQIIANFKVMLASVGADLDRVMHVNVFLKDVADFEAMNRAYVEGMGTHRPARTVIGVQDLPKAGARLTMNLMAIGSD